MWSRRVITQYHDVEEELAALKLELKMNMDLLAVRF
jgi:hypothetical protein